MLAQTDNEQARLTLAKRMIKAWTRERFALAEDAPVMAAQLDCTEPGCRPHETIVAFWDTGERRHQFKILKSAADVTRDDVFRLGDPAQFPFAYHPHNHSRERNT